MLSNVTSKRFGQVLLLVPRVEQKRMVVTEHQWHGNINDIFHGALLGVFLHRAREL